ncbi:tryptophan halogenase family protein [Nocardia callitridis]|uniref:Tryptophan 7-halogenase n=1 Tax=Nocardia callitridis TaxID=648753 RepID=A0ABP9KME8_9NOCA
MINNVVIVGGGTAGWMTAAYLKAAFADQISITLVESGAVGAGEGTRGDIRHFFEFLGVKEADWMPACNATYKLAVRFQDWRRPGTSFYHPFEPMRSVDGFALADWWLHDGPTDRFDKDCFVTASLCDAGRSPRHLDGSLMHTGVVAASTESLGPTMSEHPAATRFPYAYHVDTALLAAYLTTYSVERGVRHIIDEVTDVRLDERGWIDRVLTEEHGELRGELYIDCTGFRGSLLNEALEVPFVSYQDTLPNDSAVTLRVPLDMEKSDIPACTTVTTQQAGWIWKIPLFGRLDAGYVYAEDYCTPDEAQRTLREFVGQEAADVEAEHIRMRIGRSESSWRHNCVAIGPSSGFLEPLESTGIFLIHHAVEQLVKHFPAEDWHPGMRKRYNSAVNHAIDGVREFLVVHYRAAGRKDTQYWKDTKTRAIPDALAERIECWQAQLPDTENIFPYYHGLTPSSYMCILLGAGSIGVPVSPALSLSDQAAARKEFAAIRTTARDLVKTLPTHYEYLAQLRRA